VDHPHRQIVARGLAGEWIDEIGQDDCRSALCIGALRVSAPVAAAKHHHRSDNNRHHKWNKNYVAI